MPADPSIEFGRLPQDVASWVSRLLDLGMFCLCSAIRLVVLTVIDIVEFRKCTMVDCPAKLSTGADLILSLSVYMKTSAFQPPKITPDDNAQIMFNEGQETEAEQILRERKRSLLSLFKRINLKPRKGNHISNSKLDQADFTLLTQRPNIPKQTQATSSGNGEDEDGEGDITEDQIDLIYKKCVCHTALRDWANGTDVVEGHSRMTASSERWNLLTRSRSS